MSPVSLRPLVFIWDNFGPTHIDRAEAVADGIYPQKVIGIELSKKSRDYDWDRETSSKFKKLNLVKESDFWPLTACKIVFLIAAQRPSAIFCCHYERPEIFFSSLILKSLGYSIHTMIDSKFDDTSRQVWKELLKKFFFLPYSGAIVGSQRTSDYLEFLGFKKNLLVPGYDAISIERIRRLSKAPIAPDGIGFDDRHFTLVARLIPVKNISMALDAFALLRQGGSKRRLVICGSGPLESELKYQASSLEIFDAVTFTGFLQTEDIAKILSKTLALILPSFSETFGIAVAESISMGVPVLVSDVCGSRDSIVRTGVNGFIFEPDNPAGLATLFNLISENEQLWSQLSLGCRDFAIKADVSVFVNSVRTLCKIPARKSPNRLAPIAIFAHRRAGSLARCLDSLEKCPEFELSDVFIFIDGPKGEQDYAAVEKVRELVKKRAKENMVVYCRDENYGIANSIINEVSKILDTHDRVIVIEDDLIVESATLAWMNSMLDMYENSTQVMQISAYQYRVYEFADRTSGVFQNFTTTWGWATWKRAWDFFDPEAQGWETVAAPGPERDAFDANGTYPFSDMLVKQMSGELDSWGIRWSWSMHKAGGLTLMPPRSLVQNIGLGESATHNSIGWLKNLTSGLRPFTWLSKDPPSAPEIILVTIEDQNAFRRGLIRTQSMRNARIKSFLSLIGINVLSARVRNRLNRVIAIAQLPPPVTGLSIVNDKIINLLSKNNLLFKSIDVSSPSNLNITCAFFRKLSKTLGACISLLRAVYRRCRTLYLPLDGGLGKIYNIAVIIFARIGKFDLYIHHHSFSYITNRSFLMILIMRLCPVGTSHIFLCNDMKSKFKNNYSRYWQLSDHRAYILSNAFTVNVTDPIVRNNQTLVIGHLSNLTEQKGAIRFIELFQRLSAAGISVRAEIAGPIKNPVIAEAIRSAGADYPDNFKWHGPLTGAAKNSFYNGLDVFVFPTRYVNEAQPVVLLEALAHGVAILSTTRGCISCDHALSPGLITDDATFDDAAFLWLSELSVDQCRELSYSARVTFEKLRNESMKQIDAIFGAIAS